MITRLINYGHFSQRFKACLLALLFIILSNPTLAEPYKILAFGDSLTAGYGMSPDDAYPKQLENMLQEKGYDVEIINAGVSGDTTTGGLNRLDWTLKNNPDLVLLGLGANDALRNLPPDLPRENITAMIEKIQAQNIDIILLGMYAPRNFGKGYFEKFDAIFPDLSEEYDIPLFPFMLEGVFENPGLKLADGLHPNEQGAKIMAQNILPFVTKFLESK